MDEIRIEKRLLERRLERNLAEVREARARKENGRVKELLGEILFIRELLNGDFWEPENLFDL